MALAVRFSVTAAHSRDHANHTRGNAILDDGLNIDVAPDEFRVAGLHARLIRGKMAGEYLVKGDAMTSASSGWEK